MKGFHNFIEAIAYHDSTIHDYRSSFLDGLDSVLSILQMPIGVPVATVSVNGARNAAILACQMLSLHNENVRHQLDKLKTSLAKQVKQEATNVSSKSSIT